MTKPLITVGAGGRAMVQRRTLVEYEPLTPAMVADHKVWEIVTPYPREMTTKYRVDQLCVNVRREGAEPKTWFVNSKSVNSLIDKFGEDEKTWVGKAVTLQVKSVEVDGNTTDAIFVA